MARGGIGGCGKKASQDVPFGEEDGSSWVGLLSCKCFRTQWPLITGARQTNSSHTLSPGLSEKRAGWGHGTLGTCAPAGTRVFFFFLSFVHICQINSKSKGRLLVSTTCWKILVQHDGDVEGGSFTF